MPSHARHERAAEWSDAVRLLACVVEQTPIARSDAHRRRALGPGPRKIVPSCPDVHAGRLLLVKGEADAGMAHREWARPASVPSTCSTPQTEKETP